jgi:GMP synthase-like glutamine amidotransferase
MQSGLVLQTQDNGTPGLLCDWASSRGIALDVLRADRWDELPDPVGYDFAVALGSDASLAGPPESDWIVNEIAWLREAESAGVPVLGICFGAQALAVALGGQVDRLATPEIGWIEVQTLDEARVPSGPWLAWHEDVLTVPPLAYELASTVAGPQAFCIGRHLGVQFHPEVTPGLLARWVEAADRGRIPAGAELVTAARQRAQAAAAAASRLFDGFARHAGLALQTPLASRI